MSTFTEAQDRRWNRKASVFKPSQQISVRRTVDAGLTTVADVPAVLIWVPLCAIATFFVFRSGFYERLCPPPATVFGFKWTGMSVWRETLVCRPYGAVIGNLQAYMDFADVIYGVLTATFIVCLHGLGNPGSPSGMSAGGDPKAGRSLDENAEHDPPRYRSPCVNAIVSVALCLIICYASRARIFDFQVANVQLSKIAPGTDNPDAWILAFLLGFFVTQMARRIMSTFMVMAMSGSVAGKGGQAK